MTTLNSPLDLLKSVCPVCGATYWSGKKARDCCKGTPAHDAWRRNLERQVAAAEAEKHHKPAPRGGLDVKPCPRCHGEPGHFLCTLCDGSGYVPENML